MQSRATFVSLSPSLLSRSLSLSVALDSLQLWFSLSLSLSLSLSRSRSRSLAFFLTDDRLAQVCLWVGENRFARCQRFRCNLARQVVLPCHSLSLVIPSTMFLIRCNTHTHVNTREQTSKAIRPQTKQQKVSTSQTKVKQRRVEKTERRRKKRPLTFTAFLQMLLMQKHP